MMMQQHRAGNTTTQRFTEGFATRDLQDAKSLLAERS